MSFHLAKLGGELGGRNSPWNEHSDHSSLAKNIHSAVPYCTSLHWPTRKPLHTQTENGYRDCLTDIKQRYRWAVIWTGYSWWDLNISDGWTVDITLNGLRQCVFTEMTQIYHECWLKWMINWLRTEHDWCPDYRGWQTYVHPAYIWHADPAAVFTLGFRFINFTRTAWSQTRWIPPLVLNKVCCFLVPRAYWIVTSTNPNQVNPSALPEFPP